MKNLVKGFILILAIMSVNSNNAQEHKKVSVKVMEKEPEITAYRLINNPDGTCAFEKGTIPSLKHMNTATFWYSNKTEEWEKNAHPAPRKQYVITVKGKIRFKVSDGSTFIIEPGVVLLAEDLKGKGHSWDMVDSDVWERLYIPITENSDDLFVPESK
ncbi:hypothetical protein ACHRV1_17725 [Flavobacterium aquidurense]|jgi:quercetin dioxygenase-like cupin family protein|uniref:hypothetical protein n=1 Tax=Flavobacterium aquidurense TaxID=362413 RepID=UPI00091E2F7C|nr:hypothetical protein [Flavobacterium aquidurense]OXA74358.1 hypothetical protein B0A67_00830 [Flavobacterium aquidurense]SHF93821.1 hypothetical protein SAMN05444481_101167 [Flavobacterium frigidimaris]